MIQISLEMNFEDTVFSRHVALVDRRDRTFWFKLETALTSRPFVELSEPSSPRTWIDREDEISERCGGLTMVGTMDMMMRAAIGGTCHPGPELRMTMGHMSNTGLTTMNGWMIPGEKSNGTNPGK